MAESKIARDKFGEFVAAVCADYAVYGPKANDSVVVFGKISSPEDLMLDYRNSTISPKDLFLPKTETVYEFDGEDFVEVPDDAGLNITDEITIVAWAKRAVQPIIITNVSELQAMQNDLAGWYELGNDIDASETQTWPGGFDPIGDNPLDGGTVFTGSFYGQGYTISNLYIYRPASPQQKLI